MLASDLGLTALAAASWSMPKVAVADSETRLLTASDEAHEATATLSATAAGSWSVPEPSEVTK